MTRAHITEDDLRQWLIERRDNCYRIANTKSGADRDGWLEDGGFFDAALDAIDWSGAPAEIKHSPPYGEWCRDPKLCAGKGYCPRDPNCGD